MTEKLKVYSKEDCMQCNFTKKWLNEHGIEYEEINVEEDEAGLNYIKDELGYQAVPVVVTPTENWYGFRPDKLAELVE